MDILTAALVRARSLVDFDNLGFVEDDPDPLDNVISEANAYLEAMTGRDIDDLDEAENLGIIWSKALRMRTEQEVVWNQEEYISDLNEDAIDIKVTGFAQTRIKPDVRKGKGMLNGWDDLNMALIMLMTDDQLEYWQDLGMIASGETVFQGYIQHDWDVESQWD